MTIQDRLDELEAEIARLRNEWKQATTLQDKALIEKRATLLIWSKEAIQRYQQASQPDLYQTAKAIFASPATGQPAKTSSTAPEYETEPDEGTSE